MRNDYTDYIKHGLFSKKHKYVAKVKYGPGATAARYFYNNDDYQAYLKNKNAKVTVNAPASVMASHKINQARLRAKNVGSTLSKTVANVGEKLSSLTSTVKSKTGSAKNEFINGRQAGIHQTPSRGAAGAAYTAKNKATELRNKAALTSHVIDNKLYAATRKAKKIAGKWKTDVTAKSSSAKLALGKAWKEAGAEYNKDLKIAQHTANAVKNYAAKKAGEAKMYAQHEIGRQKKAYNTKSKSIRHELSEMMSYHLNNNKGNWNEKFSKSLERKVANTVANKNLSASERALWIKEAARLARQNGLKISAKRLAKLVATKF